MNLRSFGLAHSFFASEGDLSLFDWALIAVSFIVFPVWAGVRVSRAGGLRGWPALGGTCVTVGVVLGAAVSELFRPSPPDAPWDFVFFGLLLFVPFLALLGYLGGVVAKAGVNHGA